MLTLTPSPVQLIDYYDDGTDTRHFTFRLSITDDQVQPLPGQFFMLYVPGIGSAPFTYSSIPDHQGQFNALIKKMGGVTTALFDCGLGATLGISGPFGKGWPINQFNGQRILIVAGGCGLAPLTSLTDSLLQQQNYQSLAILYGAANEQSQMLSSERQRWQQSIPVFNVLEHSALKNPDSYLTGTPVTAIDKVLATLEKRPTVLLLCGPEKMMQLVAEKFIAYGLDPTAIWASIERRMHCGVGLCGHCYIDNQYACIDGPTYRWDELQALTHVDTEYGHLSCQ